MEEDISKKMTHDRFFKTNMGNLQVAKDTLKKLLPKTTLEMVELNTLKMGPTEKIHAISQRQSLADIVYEVTLKSNAPGYVYIHIEAQSSPDETMPLRMMEMMTALQRHHVENNRKKIPLPVVIPLIIYTGEANYHCSTTWLDCFEPSMRSLIEKIMVEPLPLIKLGDIADTELAQHARAAVMYYAYKHVNRTSWEALLRGLVDTIRTVNITLKQDELTFDNAGLSTMLEAVLKYFIDNCKDAPSAKVLSESFIELADTLTNEVGETIMTPREVLINEGIRIGREEGREEGKQEGVQVGLLKAALGFIHLGISIESIASATGLSFKAIEQLKHAANSDETVS